MCMTGIFKFAPKIAAKLAPFTDHLFFYVLFKFAMENCQKIPVKSTIFPQICL